MLVGRRFPPAGTGMIRMSFPRKLYVAFEKRHAIRVCLRSVTSWREG